MRSFSEFRSLVLVRRRRRSAGLFLGIAVIVLALLLLTGSAVPLSARGARTLPFLFPQAFQTAASFTVDSVADESDAAPGDGICAGASGACTLRAAIQEANATAGSNSIGFSIPGPGPHVIQLASPFPAVTEPAVIDGATEPDYAGSPVVVLDGSAAGERASGLTIAGGGSTVRSLALYGFDHAAIHLLGSGQNRVEGNYLGVDPSGAAAPGNRIGVLVEDSSENVIGGPGGSNLISGNEVGVYLYGSESSGNTIAANYIGTDASGSAALGNEYGLRITAANGNRIGGTNPAERNLISGNETGIYIAGAGAGGNRIQGNYIGLDASGNALLANRQLGIYVNGASGNEIGGASETARNVIVGGQAGVTIRGAGANGNRVRGNFIGVNAAGTPPDVRPDGGVAIVDARNNVVGGPQAGERNRVFARLYGVRLVGPEAATNQVVGNIVDVIEEELEAE